MTSVVPGGDDYVMYQIHQTVKARPSRWPCFYFSYKLAKCRRNWVLYFIYDGPPFADSPNPTTFTVSMQYGPQAYGSAVMADGRVLFVGGEWNGPFPYPVSGDYQLVL